MRFFLRLNENQIKISEGREERKNDEKLFQTEKHCHRVVNFFEKRRKTKRKEEKNAENENSVF